MVLDTGTKLGPYEILEPLASGDAYKASDTTQNRTVTIRRLDEGEDAAALEREAESLAGLDHDSIARVYGVVREEDACYLVTEYVEGETLAARLERGALDLGEGLNIAIAVASALDQAHRKGIVHRHLSPRSIMLTAGVSRSSTSA